MKAQDKAGFKDLMTGALAFYKQDVSTFSLSVWWQACEPFSLEQVTKAFTAHAIDAERGRFPPMPADIVKHLQGTQTDRGLMAWGKVLEGIQRVGAYQSVGFDDPAIHAAVEDLGGWGAVCRGTMAELPHLQRRFTESHRAYAGRQGFAFPAYLIGEHEASNRTAGRRQAPPVLIGDPAKAAEVVRLGRSGERNTITSGTDAVLALANSMRVLA
jgi:hypothetical protein